MAKYSWVDGHVECPTPKRPKKVTGTRFASILGYNAWTTPFATWCEITKTYVEPFEDTIYTLAGKAIEPLQIEYMRNSYGMDNLVTPTDVYGEDYFSKTFGDFYGDIEVFGGMWDSLLVDEDGKPTTVLEFKTTKRSEDWKNGVPIYYGLQASLYARLLGIDDVIMIVSFLEDKDYKAPEKFVPNAKNTATIEFKVSEQYPEFDDYMSTVYEWYQNHVKFGISPDYDEKKDKDILAEMRKNVVPPTNKLEDLIARAEVLKARIDDAKAKMKDLDDELSSLQTAVKEKMNEMFRDGDTKVEVEGGRYVWTLSKSQTTEIDKTALERDGLIDKYSKPKETIRLNVKERK